MKLSNIFRTGVDEVEALQEVSWLEEQGFWGIVGNKIEQMITIASKRLASEGNDRDKDMFIKGEIRGIQTAVNAIDDIKKNLKKNRGGE